MAIYVEFMLADIVEKELVYKVLRHKFLLSQIEVETYLTEYFATDVTSLLVFILFFYTIFCV